MAIAQDIKELALKRIAKVQEAWNLRSEDRSTAQDAIEFLESDQSLYVKKNPAETPEHFADKTKAAVNLLGYLLSTVASTYTSPPVRQVNSTAELPENEEDWFSRVLWTQGLYSYDQVMGDVDRWCLFLGAVAIEPRYNERGFIEPLYYRRHEFEVLEDDADPRQAQAVVFLVRKDKNGQPAVMHYWDDQVFARLVSWSPDKEQGDAEDQRWDSGFWQHGLGFIPCSFLREARPQSSFYPTSNADYLVTQCKAANKYLTEFLHTARCQHGYPWVRGNVTGFSGPDALIELPPEPESAFGVASSGANLTGMREAVQWYLDLFSIAFGMAPGSMRMDPKQNMSGAAIVIERNALDEVRLRRVSAAESAERQYFNAALKLYEAHSGESVPVPVDETSLTIQFKPPKTYVERKDQREDLAFQRQYGLITKAQMLQELKPELTSEEVQARIDEVTAEEAEQKVREVLMTKNALSATFQAVASKTPPPPGAVEEMMLNARRE